MNPIARFPNLYQRFFAKHSWGLACCFCLVSTLSWAQPAQVRQQPAPPAATGSLSGQVRTATDAVPFATVLLLSATDSTVVKAMTSDEQGGFQFGGVPVGSYRVRATYVANRPATTPVFQLGHTALALGVLTMLADQVSLAEVTVKGSRPLVERRADRVVYNASSNVAAAAGTAWDLVRRTPGVLATAQGGLSIAGKQGIQVMINNRLRRLSPEELAEYLKALPGTAVDAIEVITNPPANYDAEGNAGLLNIITKTNDHEGLNGSLRLTPEQGILPKLSGSGTANYRRDKLNLYAAYNNRVGRDRYNEAVKLFYENSTWDQHDVSTRTGHAQTASVGADYNLNERNVFGVLLEVTQSNRRVNEDIQAAAFRPGLAPDSLLGTTVTNQVGRLLTSVNANYRHELATKGASLGFDLDYTPYRYDADQASRTVSSPSQRVTEFVSAAGQRTDIGSCKADYVQPLAKGLLLEAGGKFSLSNTAYDLRYDNVRDGLHIPDLGRTNRFRYDEAIEAAYATVSRTTEKLSAKVGLRTEYTQTSGQSSAFAEVVKRNYLRFFPTLYAQYKISDSQQLNLSYGVRLTRPSYAYLNPFVLYLSPYVTVAGNPFLRPSYSHNIEGTYTYKNSYSLTLSYQRVLDPFMQVAQLDNATNEVAFVRLNTNPRNVYSATVLVPVQLTPVWKLDALVSAYAQQESIGYLNSRLAYFQPTFTATAINTFRLPKDFTVQTQFMYTSASREFVQVIRHQSDVSLSVQKKFGSRSSLTLDVNDIFFGNAPRYYTDYPNQHGEYYNTAESRNVRLAYVYSFGNQKLKSSRRRATGNQDERGRTN